MHLHLLRLFARTTTRRDKAVDGSSDTGRSTTITHVEPEMPALTATPENVEAAPTPLQLR